MRHPLANQIRTAALLLAKTTEVVPISVKLWSFVESVVMSRREKANVSRLVTFSP